MEAFEANADRYVPQFGGFCAYGVSVGKKFDGDPLVWAVDDGLLLLNLNEDIRELWMEDEAGNVAKARKSWLSIRDTAPAAL